MELDLRRRKKKHTYLKCLGCFTFSQIIFNNNGNQASPIYFQIDILFFINTFIFSFHIFQWLRHTGETMFFGLTPYHRSRQVNLNILRLVLGFIVTLLYSTKTKGKKLCDFFKFQETNYLDFPSCVLTSNQIWPSFFRLIWSESSSRILLWWAHIGVIFPELLPGAEVSLPGPIKRCQTHKCSEAVVPPGAGSLGDGQVGATRRCPSVDQEHLRGRTGLPRSRHRPEKTRDVRPLLGAVVGKASLLGLWGPIPPSLSFHFFPPKFCSQDAYPIYRCAAGLSEVARVCSNYPVSLVAPPRSWSENGRRIPDSLKSLFSCTIFECMRVHKTFKCA